MSNEIYVPINLKPQHPPPPPPRAYPRAFDFFYFQRSNSPPPGPKTCSNAPHVKSSRQSNAPPPGPCMNTIFTDNCHRLSHVFHINRGILYTYVQKCPWVSSTHSFSAIRSQTQYLSHQNRSTFLLCSTPSTCDTTRMPDVTYSPSAVFALHGQMPHPPRVTCQMPHSHSGFEVKCPTPGWGEGVKWMLRFQIDRYINSSLLGSFQNKQDIRTKVIFARCRRQRQRREAAKIFLSNPGVLVSLRILLLYYLLLFSPNFRNQQRLFRKQNTDGHSQVGSHILKKTWKQSKRVSHESTTAQTSDAISHIHVRSLSSAIKVIVLLTLPSPSPAVCLRSLNVDTAVRSRISGDREKCLHAHKMLYISFRKKIAFPFPRQLFMPNKILIKYITTAGWTG